MLNCFICDKECKTLNLLRIHVSKHDVSLSERYMCRQNGCIRVFDRLKSLYQHIKRQHGNLNEPTKFIQSSNEIISLSSSTRNSSIALASVSASEPQINFEDSDLSLQSSSSSESCIQSFNRDDLSFVLSHYCKNNFNRSDIIGIINRTSLWAHNKFGVNPFQNLDSDYKIMKALEKESLWIQPNEFVLDFIEDVVVSGASQKIKMKPYSCHTVPLKETFCKILGNENLLALARDYMTKRNDTILSDAKDGTLFRNMPDNTFPFTIFFDEIETGNCLGSHKGEYKLGMFYVSLRCFPPQFYSKLCNINLYAVLPAGSTRQRYICKVLSKLAEEISELEISGVIIDGFQCRFKFMGLVGDNLGQHQILGFSGSFSANFPCRACRATRNACSMMMKEDELLLRNPVNYVADVATDDISLTGVKFDCPLNKIPSYHVTKNMIFDIMHDLLEGVCNYGMCSIIHRLISDRIISLDKINSRIYSFHFIESSNRPPQIQLKNVERESLGYSAAEMLCLTLWFSLIVGDAIPEGYPVWHYYLTLREILDLVLRKCISVSEVSYLDVLIQEHNEQYVHVFSKHLKPKHHHLVHYKRCILSTGPLCHNWAMRFESKNYVSKLFASSTKSRVNLCKTIALRHMFLFANNLLETRNKSTLSYPIHGGPTYFVNNIGTCYKWIKFDGIRYVRNSIVNISHSFSEFLPSFGRLKYLRSIQGSPGVMTIIELFDTQTYSKHLCSYTIEVRHPPAHEVYQLSEISKPLTIVTIENQIHVSDVGLT